MGAWVAALIAVAASAQAQPRSFDTTPAPSFSVGNTVFVDVPSGVVLILEPGPRLVARDLASGRRRFVVRGAALPLAIEGNVLLALSALGPPSEVVLVDRRTGRIRGRCTGAALRSGEGHDHRDGVAAVRTASGLVLVQSSSWWYGGGADLGAATPPSSSGQTAFSVTVSGARCTLTPVAMPAETQTAPATLEDVATASGHVMRLRPPGDVPPVDVAVLDGRTFVDVSADRAHVLVHRVVAGSRSRWSLYESRTGARVLDLDLDEIGIAASLPTILLGFAPNELVGCDPRTGAVRYRVPTADTSFHGPAPP